MNIKGIVPSNGLLHYLKSTITVSGRSRLKIYTRNSSSIGASSRKLDSIQSTIYENNESSRKNRQDSLAFLIGDGNGNGNEEFEYDKIKDVNKNRNNLKNTNLTNMIEMTTIKERSVKVNRSIDSIPIDALPGCEGEGVGGGKGEGIRGVNKNISPRTGIIQSTNTTTSPIDQFNQNWIIKMKSILKSHEWDHFHGALLKGIKRNYFFDIRSLEIIMNKLLYHNQFNLVLKIFETYEEICAQDRRCVSSAVKAAMRSGNNELCEEIFEKYFDILQDDLKTLETVLANFISNSNLTFAKAFLYQIWSKANEYTIKIFLNGAINIAENSNDLKEVFEKWRQRQYYSNSSISPLVYKIVLEGFWKLNCKEEFNQVYQCIVNDGLEKELVIEQCLAGIALCEGDLEEFNKILNRGITYRNENINSNNVNNVNINHDNSNNINNINNINDRINNTTTNIPSTPLSSLSNSTIKTNNNPDSDLYHSTPSTPNTDNHLRYFRRRIFSNAINYHAKNGQVEKMQLIIKLMIDHGYEIKQDTIFAVIDGLCEVNDFPLVDYLKSCQSIGILTQSMNDATTEQIATSTLDHIFKVLLLKYPQLRQTILTEFKNNRHSLPAGFTQEIVPLLMKRQNRQLKTIYVPKPKINNPNNTIQSLRLIQEYNLSRHPENGIKILEDLARRGIMPNRRLFMTVLRGLVKEEERVQTSASLRNQIDFVLRMMHKMGHSVDIELETLAIQLDLLTIKKDKLTSFNNKRSRALSTIRNFYNDKNQQLPLEARTMLGYHLLYYKEHYRAIGLFDSLRDGGKFTIQNHDSVSLTGMIKAYREAKDFQGLITILKQFLNDKADIVLHKQFLKELRITYEKALKIDILSSEEFLILRQKCEQHNIEQKQTTKTLVDEVTKLFSKTKTKTTTTTT